MKKIFVIDTNVLLYDPSALFRFEENDIVIPIYVIEEIDNFKNDMSELGRNAREVSRHIDSLREKGSLASGVKLPTSGILTIKSTDREISAVDKKVDSKILAVAMDEHENRKNKKTQVVLVTRDTNLRIRADALSIPTQDYTSDKIQIDDLYTGHRNVQCTGQQIDELFDEQQISVTKVGLHPNQYVTLNDVSDPRTALARCVEDGTLVPLTVGKGKVWGIQSKNREQQFALDLLLNDEIKLVTLVGKAGTGKTLLAIAAGLQRVVEDRKFGKLLVSRPVFPLGKDIGFLPGTVEEKLNPWMQPIYDNLDYLMNFDNEKKRNGRSSKEIFDLGYIQIEALTYIRGRSIPNQFMIVDEAQNLTPHEVKTIISRAGVGTKIVLTGDPDQIDNPYIDATNNGLTYVVNKFKDQKIAGHITLLKGERSELAEIATQIL